MASNKGRLLSSIMKLSAPKLGLPYNRPDPAILSGSNSLSRLLCSSTQQGQETGSNKVEGEVSETKPQVLNGEGENSDEDEDDGDELDLNKETGEIGGQEVPSPLGTAIGNGKAVATISENLFCQSVKVID